MSDLIEVHLSADRLIVFAPRTMAIGDQILLVFRGELLSTTLAENGIRNFVLDLSACRYLDSAGCGALVTGYTAALKNGVWYTLNGATGGVYNFLVVTKLAQVLTLTDVDYSGLPRERLSPAELFTRVSGLSPAPEAVARPLTRPLKIFLCHASEDKRPVRDLYERLRAGGFAPWLDEVDILPGQEWEREIPRAVRDSDVVIVCLSQAAVSKSGYINKELGFALNVADEQPEGAIYIIPLRLEMCDVPARLSRWQWVDLFEDYGYNRLVLTLRLCSFKLPAP